MGYPFVQFYKVPPSYYNYFKLGSAQSMRNQTVCLKNIHACMYLTHTNFGCIPLQISTLINLTISTYFMKPSNTSHRYANKNDF